MLDIFGVEVKVGEEVVYSRGGQSDQGMYRGVILEIKESHINFRTKEKIMGALIKDNSGRTQQKLRTSVVSTLPTKTVHPDLFI